MANYFHCWILSVCTLLCIVKYSRILFANSWQGVNKNHKQNEELGKLYSKWGIIQNWMTKLFLTFFPFFIESLYCCLLSTLLVSLKSNCLISTFEIVLCLKTSHTRTESHCNIFRSDKHTGPHICTGTQHTAPQYKCTQYTGALAHTDAHWHTQQTEAPTSMEMVSHHTHGVRPLRSWDNAKQSNRICELCPTISDD